MGFVHDDATEAGAEKIMASSVGLDESIETTTKRMRVRRIGRNEDSFRDGVPPESTSSTAMLEFGREFFGATVREMRRT